MKILLIGLAGVGKSTLATALAEHLGWACHALDDHRRALADGSIAGDYLARAAFLRSCAAPGSGIYEFGGCGPHRHGVRLALEESGEPVHVVWLRASSELRAARLAAREQAIPGPSWGVAPGEVEAALEGVLRRDQEDGFWTHRGHFTSDVQDGERPVEELLRSVLWALGRHAVPRATPGGSGPGVFVQQPRESVLLVTLDSCRYDTARQAHTPALRTLGEPMCAMAPSHFTLASHAAMWVGTTPGLAQIDQPVLNPKRGRLFRLASALVPAGPDDVFALEGATIIEGFARRGYRTLGTGAVDWFDTSTPTGRALVAPFQRFRFVRGPGAIETQLTWLAAELWQAAGTPLFCFLNAAETHVPYWHQGARWSRSENPCRPFAGASNDAALCRQRQQACLEHLDRALAPLLAAFAQSTVMVCGDHGDCWGEDGLWEHGIWHPKAMEVPLWVRVRGEVLNVTAGGGSPC